MQNNDFQQDILNNMDADNSNNDDINLSSSNEDDSETDPKKEIQQLTGKLSQALRQYNNNQDKPDTELNKYVAGMIIPQASKSLTNDDKDEVIKKINTNSSDDNIEDEETDDESINEIVNNLIDYEKKRNNIQLNKKIKKNNPFVSNR